mgnify:FL=1
MQGPDTGRARIRFRNANGGQQNVMQNYRAITYAQSTENIEIPKNKTQLNQSINILGKKNKQHQDYIQIQIFDDGTIEKRIIIKE